MSRALGVSVCVALFALIGLGSAFGYASLHQPQNSPDSERLFYIALPAVWAIAGLGVVAMVSRRVDQGQ